MPTIEDYEHKDATRVNLPREETRDFVSREERVPQMMRYPRDPSLDPQLVWKGKDAQDGEDLAVPAVPIYIQEEIEPRALINNLYNKSQAESDQPTLFPVSSGSAWEGTVDFYKHEEQWRNRLILGDSLLVMTSLAEKEGLRGKVQTIYIDPPYGIKFGSNWQVSTRKRDVKDGNLLDATREPEQVKAFRDTWELGIHSYLSYLRDRLTVARELLTESGSIFVQIGVENLHLLRSLLDEAFGSVNFISMIAFRKTTTQSGDRMPDTNDYLLWYGKNAEDTKYKELFSERSGNHWVNYDYIRLSNDSFRRLSPAEKRDSDSVPKDSVVYRRSPLTSSSSSTSTLVPIVFEGHTYVPGTGGWKTNSAGFERLMNANRLEAYGRTLSFRRYVTDFPYFPMSNSWSDTASGGYVEDKVYVVQTNRKVAERCLLMTTDPGDLVLDPTCGSGTTAYVAEEWGRRWITIDTSRVALQLARTRIMAARYPYYLLADSPEGVRKEQQLTGIAMPESRTGEDIRKGFVYERVPHVTLKSIANNPDIHEGMTREEIDKAIARHADTEILYDKPYEDKKKVRVSGPFTVESLSPHRILPPDDLDHDGKVTASEVLSREEFEIRILAALKSAGVQNTIKGERITFERLERTHANVALHARGEYTDANGETRAVAVAIGPEYGTVGADLIKEAAKAAVRGVGFDILVVCGFAFDGQATEEAKRYGDLTVLPTRMSMELIMQGKGQLKNTGSGNLFMVFGEPDIAVQTTDGMVTVEIRGIDVFDPRTDAVRSSSTDDLACWFIDTNYSEEAFFVRHAYFTGGNEPYERLRKTLRAEIDEAAWESLYSTVSRPFPVPETGKIAVKAINHYGDEVLKVIQIPS